jgi:hypothetical protein
MNKIKTARNILLVERRSMLQIFFSLTSTTPKFSLERRKIFRRNIFIFGSNPMDLQFQKILNHGWMGILCFVLKLGRVVGVNIKDRWMGILSNI